MTCNSLVKTIGFKTCAVLCVYYVCTFLSKDLSLVYESGEHKYDEKQYRSIFVNLVPFSIYCSILLELLLGLIS